MAEPIAECDLAYAAGIIDGEGCITVIKQRYATVGWPTNYALSVRVLTTDHVIVPWLQETFGGSYATYTDGRTIKGSIGKERRWQLASAAAEKFLRAVMPWLKLKRPQAELALQFRKLIGRKGRPISDENRNSRELIFQQMKALKKVRIS